MVVDFEPRENVISLGDIEKRQHLHASCLLNGRMAWHLSGGDGKAHQQPI
jgi:hypothetical protein